MGGRKGGKLSLAEFATIALVTLLVVVVALYEMGALALSSSRPASTLFSLRTKRGGGST